MLESVSCKGQTTAYGSGTRLQRQSVAACRIPEEPACLSNSGESWSSYSDWVVPAVLSPDWRQMDIPDKIPDSYSHPQL